MDAKLLTALASYCTNPKCKWASLDEEANISAKRLFESWNRKNHWQEPWDGFLPIVKAAYPAATKVSTVYTSAFVTFPWNGQTWGVE